MREAALLVSCPHCNAQYHIPPDLIGENAECPRCGKEFTMLQVEEKEKDAEKESLPPEKEVLPETPHGPPPGIVFVSCTSCGVKFEVPEEFLGDTAECSECGDYFTLAADPNIGSDDTEIISARVALDEEENVVRFYRRRVGMLPEVKDRFSVAVVATHSSLNIPKEIIPEPPPKKKWWQFWK